MAAAPAKLLIILAFAETVTGTSQVTAAEGDNVTLQCRVDPPVSVSALTLDWKRVDNKDVVHAYRHKQDHPGAQTGRYRGRTTLDHDDLNRGIVTLLISPVQLSDRGSYKCYVPRLHAACIIDLDVVKGDEQNGTKTTTTGPPVGEVTPLDIHGTSQVTAAEGDNVTLQCRVDPPVSVSALTLDWKRVDNKDVVHAYRHKQDHPGAQTGRYRGRTTLDHDDLNRGIVTLLISPVQLSDRGSYKCYVPRLHAACIIDLDVVKGDEQNGTKTTTTGPPVGEVTPLDIHGGANRNAVLAGIISMVVVAILCVLVVVLALKRKNIQDRVKRLRGRKEQQPQMMSNRSAGEKLNTQEEEEDEEQEMPTETFV